MDGTTGDSAVEMDDEGRDASLGTGGVGVLSLEFVRLVPADLGTRKESPTETA